MNYIISILALMILSTTIYAQNWNIIDLGGSDITPNDINNSGQVVGYKSINGSYLPFLYENGVLNTFIGLGGHSGIAQSINDQGHIVGTIYGADYRTYHGFLYSNAN